MFKVFIAGKTIEELRSNTHRFWVGLSGHPSADGAVPFTETEISDMVTESYEQKPPKSLEAKRPIFNDLIIPDIKPVAAPTDPNAQKDSRGIPFDARIHSKEGELNKNGSWRYRRNADKALIRQIESAPVTASPTLSAPSFAAPTALPSFVNPQVTPIFNTPLIPDIPFGTVPPAVAVPNIAPAPMTFQQATQPPPQAAPVVATPFVPQVVQAAPIAPQQTYEEIAVPASASQPAHDLASFKNNFSTTMSQLIAAKKIDQPWIAEVNRAFGIQNIWEVTKNEAQLSQLFDCLCQNGLITKVG